MHVSVKRVRLLVVYYLDISYILINLQVTNFELENTWFLVFILKLILMLT